MRFLIMFIAGLLLTTLLLSGCSGPTHFKTLKNTVLSPAYWNRMTPVQQTKVSRQEIKHALSLNDYEQAQKLLVVARNQNVSEAQLKEFYPQIINQFIISAKQATEANAPARAGRFYMLAREIYPSATQHGSTIDLSMSAIDEQMQQCADDQMKVGLIAYRSGNLGIAIDTWTKIDPFFPDHDPSRIAIKTAQQQLQNLKNLASNNTKQP